MGLPLSAMEVVAALSKVHVAFLQALLATNGALHGEVDATIFSWTLAFRMALLLMMMNTVGRSS